MSAVFNSLYDGSNLPSSATEPKSGATYGNDPQSVGSRLAYIGTREATAAERYRFVILLDREMTQTLQALIDEHGPAIVRAKLESLLAATDEQQPFHETAF